MKKLIFIIIIAPFVFCNCSKTDPISEDTDLENENPQDSTEVEVINNPNDTITQNIIFVFNHDYVYNSYNNDFMNFDISSCSVNTKEKWNYDLYGNKEQDGYTSQIVFYATGSRVVKDQYNKLHSQFIDILLLINIVHPDSTIYGEYYINEKLEGNVSGQLQTWFFYTDPSDKGTFAGGHYNLAPYTTMNIAKSKTPGHFTLTISEGNVFYQTTQYTPLLNEKNMFQIDIRYKGEY